MLPDPTVLDDVTLLSLPKAAALLDVSHSTVWRMVREGELQSVPVRGKWRVTIAELRRYVQAQQGLRRRRPRRVA